MLFKIKNMKHLILIPFFCFASHSLLSNCIFKIRLIHPQNHKANEITVLNFQETKAETINDSVAVYSFKPEVPTNAIILINKEERWHTFVWMNPDRDTVELMVDFESKISSIKKPKHWDLTFHEYNKLFDAEEYFKADKFAESYIEANRDSYLSLWLLAHGVAFHNRPLRLKLFNLLSTDLKVYKDYRDVESDIKNRFHPTIGQDFKEFTLPGIHKEKFNSAAINNKIIVLHFWTNGCGACVRGIDELARFNKKIDTNKIKFISICFDDDQQTWQKSNACKKINWTNVWESNGVYCDLCLYYDLNVMPLFVLFNKEKKLQALIEGEDVNQLQTELSKIK